MHGSVIAHRGVVDHVVPRKRGGRTEPGNLVTACYPCNFGKAHYTLEELGMCAPRPAMRDGWDGLQGLVPALKRHGRSMAVA
jgi:HNH endonuclease